MPTNGTTVPSDAAHVTAIRDYTDALNLAICDYDAANKATAYDEHRTTAAWQKVETAKDALCGLLTTRLDHLAVRHLLAAEGTWGITFLTEVDSLLPANCVQALASIRWRYEQLRLLAQLLSENEAKAEVLQTPSGIETELTAVRQKLAANVKASNLRGGSGYHGVPVNTSSEFAAFVTNEDPFQFALPRLKLYWDAMFCTGLKDVPPWTGEPENEMKAFAAIDAALRWCQSHVRDSRHNISIACGNTAVSPHLKKLLDELVTQAPEVRTELETLVPVLCSLASLLCVYSQEGVFKGKTKVSEKTFQAFVVRELRRSLGPDVQGHGDQAGGILDVRFQGVIVELKVERENGDRRVICARYCAQTTQYASAEARQVAVLFVLDLTEKSNPPAAIHNDILLIDVSTHGGDDKNKRYPSKAFVFILNGNIRNPSSYSKKRRSRKQA